MQTNKYFAPRLRARVPSTMSSVTPKCGLVKRDRSSGCKGADGARGDAILHQSCETCRLDPRQAMDAAAGRSSALPSAHGGDVEVWRSLQPLMAGLLREAVPF